MSVDQPPPDSKDSDSHAESVGGSASGVDSGKDAGKDSGKPGDEGDELSRMSFGDHLDELRKRLVRAMLAIVIAVMALVPFKQQVTEIIVSPYRQLWLYGYEEYLGDLDERHDAGTLHSAEETCWEWNQVNSAEVIAGTFPLHEWVRDKGGFQMPYELIATGGVKDFWVFMKAALIFALAVSSPVVVWQIWAFIGAGLYNHERKTFYKFFPFGMVLLIAGTLFGYFLVVPTGLYFLIRLMNPGLVQVMLTIDEYFSFLFTLTLALGLVFQLPLVMVAVQKVGLVTHQGFKKNWRFVILGFFVFSAAFTPPDPFTQVMMAAPLTLLYGLGLVLTHRIAKASGELAATNPPAGSA